MGNTVPLSEDQLQFVTFLHQHYAINGELLTAEKAKEDFGIPKTKFAEWITNEDVKSALDERGIVLSKFHTDPNSWQSKSLTPIQLITANSLLDLADTRTDKKKLQDLGVSTGQYQSWLRDPMFSDYLRTRAELLLGDSLQDAHLALLDRVRSGDTKALTLYYEITGRFISQAGRGNAEAAVINLQQMIIKIVEIIQEEVSNPQEAAKIGERLEALTMGANLAGVQQQVNEVQAVPETAKPRELSTDLKHLVDHGQGVNI